MSGRSVELGTIRQHCKTLRMPTVASQFHKLAEQARRDKQSHVRYLDVLLSAEVEEREHRAVQRRLKEAQLPRTKTVDEFDFSQSPKVSGRRIKELAEGHYIDQAQPVIFLGDAGTGKTHLASALCVAACQQRRRVRFTTASRLVNELVEARQEHELSRIIRRYARFELLCIDELGYVPLADVGARAVVPGDLGAKRDRRARDHDESPVLRMDPGVHQRSTLQGAARSCDRPGAHPRDRLRVLPLPPHRPQQEQGSKGMRAVFSLGAACTFVSAAG